MRGLVGLDSINGGGEVRLEENWNADGPVLGFDIDTESKASRYHGPK